MDSAPAPTPQTPRPHFEPGVTATTLVGGIPLQTTQPSSNPASTPAESVQSRATQSGKRPAKREAWWFYVPRISATVLLLLAPWIFYGVVVLKDQLALSRSTAETIARNPRTTTHIVVTLGGLVSTAVTLLFSAAVVCVAQKWISISDTTPNRALTRSKDSALQNFDKYPVRIEYLGRLAQLGSLQPLFALNSRRALAVTALALVVYAIGNQALAGISAVFTPQALNLTTPFTGFEIDLSSTDATCIDWYLDPKHAPPQNCGYNPANDLVFTTCLGENQLIDVIQAGRDNAALVNSTVPTTFPRMNSTRFLGPFPGVLMVGPNGLNNFSIVTPNNTEAFSEWPTPGMSYNYSLPLQGISLNVSCDYQNDTALNVSVVSFGDAGSGVQFLNWTGPCPTGTSSFLDLSGDSYQTLASNLSMGIWACKQDSADNAPPGYLVYVQGVNDYRPSVGKMTCAVNVALADYEIEYLGNVDYFKTSQGPNITEQNSDAPNVFASVFDEVIRRGVDIGINAQTALTGNLVTEAMLSIGAEYYGLNQTTPDDNYPKIFAAVLQGMLSYQAGYLRMIYAGEDIALPQHCFRAINGIVSFTGMGWSIQTGQFDAPFLVAYTVVLLLTLMLYIVALCMPKPWDSWNPTDPTEVCVAAYEQRLVFREQPGAEDAREHYICRPVENV
ncbi:hypothetical protein BDN72DRAFT_900914 [Pluteus cervinus]|uniref:Uncharacterized protein n=1 Tax=Pluteus cervinus TaxID=181527 RepID=A0ACD3AHG8_9AGAR|nr:hypothetical protein BDN72DRAFT_900914 [Pluteus cervinus]